MTENITIVFKSDYEKFQDRAFGFYSRVTFFIAVFFMNIFLHIYKSPWYYKVSVNLIFLWTITDLILKNIYYIDEIIIDPDLKTIEYSVYRFDRLQKRKQIQIYEAEIKIVNHWMVRHMAYELKIFHKRKCIVRQNETKYWTFEKFEEIKKQIQKIK